MAYYHKENDAGYGFSSLHEKMFGFLFYYYSVQPVKSTATVI